MTRRVIATRVALAVLLYVAPARAQQADAAADATVTTPAPEPAPTRDALLFLAGGAIGLGLHEAGHVVAAALFDSDLGTRRVGFGPIPFVAITHEAVSPAREYTISSAGFTMQHLSSEWLLTARPDLRDEHAPIAKGILAFNLLSSAAYSVAGFAKIGPPERDTRAMAQSARTGEAWVGALILAPAVLDGWRYLHPGSRWARWSSRAAKVGLVLMVVRAAR